MKLSIFPIAAALLVCAPTIADERVSEADTYYEKAVVLQQHGSYSEAIQDYNQAISLEPQRAVFYFALGSCFHAQHNLEEALKCYRKAAFLDKRKPVYAATIQQTLQEEAGPLISSGITKMSTANASGSYDLDGAIADFRAALKISDESTTHFYLGQALRHAGREKEAEVEFEKAKQRPELTPVDDTRNTSENVKGTSKKPVYQGVPIYQGGYGNGSGYSGGGSYVGDFWAKYWFRPQ